MSSRSCAVHDRLQIDERRLDALLLPVRELGSGDLGEVRRAQRFLGRENDGFGLVARLDEQARREVGFGVLERVEQHPLDLLVGQAVGRLDLDRLLDVGAQLARGDAQDAVRVDLKLHLHARHAGRHRRNAAQLEARQRSVVGHQLALALQHVDVHGRLVVDGGREHLAAGRRNRRVAQDDLRHHAAHRLDAERERRHVEQQHLAVAGDEDVGLHGGAERDDLVGVQLAVRRPAEQLADQAPDERDARRAADQDDLVDLRRLEARVGERLPARLERAIDDRTNQRFELGAGEPLAVQLGGLAVREIPFRLDDGLADFLDAFRRLRPPHLGQHAVHQQQVDVVAAQVRVAAGRQHLEDAVFDAKNRDVERAAAEVVDGDEPGVALVEAVGERRRRRLVDDAQDVEAGDAAGVARRRALRVVEVRRAR